MALYGGARDMSLFRNINREVMHNIISQQCVLYKYDLEETKVNIYGEAANEKYYHPPVLLYCLIETCNFSQANEALSLFIDLPWPSLFDRLRNIARY